MILLDHCVRRKIFRSLQSWGYEVTLLHEIVSPETEDIDVIKCAQELDAILLTEDKDFTNILDYPPQEFQGIIVMRNLSRYEDGVIAKLKEALEVLYRDSLRGALIVIETDNFRIKG